MSNCLSSSGAANGLQVIDPLGHGGRYWLAGYGLRSQDALFRLHFSNHCWTCYQLAIRWVIWSGLLLLQTGLSNTVY